MAEPTTYSGSCHCGAVRYAVTTTIETVLACNCSICRRSGSLLAFVPESAFALERGDDALTSYRFNKHRIDHVFCKTCGVKSFARGTRPDGTPMVAINVRCLDGVDVDELAVKHFDGAAL